MKYFSQFYLSPKHVKSSPTYQLSPNLWIYFFQFSLRSVLIALPSIPPQAIFSSTRRFSFKSDVHTNKHLKIEHGRKKAQLYLKISTNNIFHRFIAFVKRTNIFFIVSKDFPICVFQNWILQNVRAFLSLFANIFSAWRSQFLEKEDKKALNWMRNVLWESQRTCLSASYAMQMIEKSNWSKTEVSSCCRSIYDQTLNK